MTYLKSQAVQTALAGDWENAIFINQQILADNPEDIDTLNRLAYAYLSHGCIKESKAIYQKVLTLDIKNPIALRNLKKLSESKVKKANCIVSNLFIEEPGKTKVIELINVADKKIIAYLRPGEKLLLNIKRMKIFALDQENNYIGMLPDDVCKRLIKFINGGNKYEAYARTTDSNRLSIFIRELKRVKKFENQPSFVYSEKPKITLENTINTLKSQSSTNKHKKEIAE